MAAFPPHQSLPSQPIPAENALTYLQSYLTATKASPYLLPNARLEPSGPSASSTNSSVTMHNLQRVEAGLRGEWLAPVLDLEEAVPVAVGSGRVDDGIGAEGDHMDAEGWQDLEEYQREQSDVEGEINPASMAVDMETGGAMDVPDEVEAAPKPAPKPEKLAKKPKEKKSLSKEEKKLEKKARLKEEQRKKAEEKRLAGEAAARQA